MNIYVYIQGDSQHAYKKMKGSFLRRFERKIKSVVQKCLSYLGFKFGTAKNSSYLCYLKGKYYIFLRRLLGMYIAGVGTHEA